MIVIGSMSLHGRTKHGFKDHVFCSTPDDFLQNAVEKEGLDRRSIELPGVQEDLVTRVITPRFLFGLNGQDMLGIERFLF